MFIDYFFFASARFVRFHRFLRTRKFNSQMSKFILVFGSLCEDNNEPSASNKNWSVSLQLCQNGCRLKSYKNNHNTCSTFDGLQLKNSHYFQFMTLLKKPQEFQNAVGATTQHKSKKKLKRYFNSNSNCDIEFHLIILSRLAL